MMGLSLVHMAGFPLLFLLIGRCFLLCLSTLFLEVAIVVIRACSLWRLCSSLSWFSICGPRDIWSMLWLTLSGLISSLCAIWEKNDGIAATETLSFTIKLSTSGTKNKWTYFLMLQPSFSIELSTTWSACYQCLIHQDLLTGFQTDVLLQTIGKLVLQIEDFFQFFIILWFNRFIFLQICLDELHLQKCIINIGQIIPLCIFPFRFVSSLISLSALNSLLASYIVLE